mgnify:FL=1
MSFAAETLARFRDVDEIRVAPYAEDGFAYDGRLVWVVVVDGRVFIRSWKGAEAEWFVRSARSRRARITVHDEPDTGIEVVFQRERDADVQARIDAEYLRKYPRPYSHEMTLPAAAATTLEVLPA